MTRSAKLLRIQIELAAVLARFAVAVQIGSKKRRSLRRACHLVVGKHLDHAGAEEIRIDIAFLAVVDFLAFVDELLHRLVDVAVGFINEVINVERHAHAHGYPAGTIEQQPHVLLLRPHSRIHQRSNAIGRHVFQHSGRERCPLLERQLFLLDLTHAIDH